jgi:hypothetical protein
MASDQPCGKEIERMDKRKNAIGVIVFVLLALTGTALAAPSMVGKVNDASDGTPANGHTVICYYPGDEAHYDSDIIGPTGRQGVDNHYLCYADSIPGHTWSVGDIINVKVIDNGDGYTAGPVSVVTTEAIYDLAPDMTLQAIPQVPLQTPIGLVALVGLLSAVAVLTMRRKRL